MPRLHFAIGNSATAQIVRTKIVANRLTEHFLFGNKIAMKREPRGSNKGEQCVNDKLIIMRIKIVVPLTTEMAVKKKKENEE